MTNKFFTKRQDNAAIFIGLMSGTSLDGIDASIIKTDGDKKLEILDNLYFPYENIFTKKLQEVIITKREFLHIETELTKQHSFAALKIMNKANLSSKAIKAIGFHGQTIYHNPSKGICWQIGNPHLLAQLTGIDVIHDFRRRDIANQGHGAPLIPVYHRCLANNCHKPVVILNIGGIANITYIGDDDQLIAFDTGPGNALINDIMQSRLGRPFDHDGLVAASGNIEEQLLNHWLQDSYFTAGPPKSLDRNHFQWVLQQTDHIQTTNLITTLTNFTVKSIIKAMTMLPTEPKELYICGGGIKNKYMIDSLKKHLNIKDINDLGNYDPNFIESQGFAYLAARYLAGLPSSFPTTTGAKTDTRAGVLVTAT